MGARILVIVTALSLLPLFLKYFERKSIYFPTRVIEATPASVGLDYQDVFFKTEDGVKLHGWFIPASSGSPALLLCHGNGGNISHRIDSIAIFHGMGLSVFAFDYRGYGKSRGIATEKGTYLDAQAAYGWLAQRGCSERIFVFGRSLGGPVAIDLATRAKVRGLICESCFTSIMDMAKEIYGFRPPNWSISNKYDGLSVVSQISAPKLFIHSRGDEVVPFHHGEKLFELAAEPKEFFQIQGSHNDGFLLTANEYATRIKAFVEKCLEQDN